MQYWIERYRAGLDAERASGAWAEDRPSTPHRQPGEVSDEVHDRVCEARRRTGWGPRLIACELGWPTRRSACLARRGMSRRPRAPKEAVRRFEWPCPGDLLQMDTKRLARFSRPGHTVTGDRSTHQRREARAGGLGVLPLDHRRPQPPGLHRAARRRARPTVTAFVAARARVLRRARHPAPAVADRQRLDLYPQPRAAELLAATASATAPSRPARPSATARSSATSRPSDANGASASATAQARPSRSTATLATPLQHHQKPQLPRKPAAHHPRSERPEAEQLDAGHHR